MIRRPPTAGFPALAAPLLLGLEPGRSLDRAHVVGGVRLADVDDGIRRVIAGRVSGQAVGRTAAALTAAPASCPGLGVPPVRGVGVVVAVLRRGVLRRRVISALGGTAGLRVGGVLGRGGPPAARARGPLRLRLALGSPCILGPARLVGTLGRRGVIGFGPGIGVRGPGPAPARPAPAAAPRAGPIVIGAAVAGRLAVPRPGRPGRIRPCRIGPCRIGPCRIGPCRIGPGRIGLGRIGRLAADAGSARGGGGWNTTCGGWNTAAGTLGAGRLSSPVPRPPPALSSNSLSFSSLSSIRAISSQAPGRASPRRSARRRRTAARTRTAQEHIVSKGAGEAAVAAPVSRGTRARPAALSLFSFFTSWPPCTTATPP